VHRAAKAEKRAKNLAPHVQTVMINECSHMMQIDQPSITVDLILNLTLKENFHETVPVKLTAGQNK
jgi:pimeloyl-ACP methyl ester carboxylesterase